MEGAYRPDLWQPLFSAVASAAAALTGLLFIALSLNRRPIMGHPDLAAMARETLGGLLSLLGLAVLMLVPSQPRQVLGAELVAYGLVLLGIAFQLQSRTARRLPRDHRLRWLLRISAVDAGALTVVVGGAGLAAGSLGGLFWLVPTVLIYLTWAALNAWQLMVRVAE